MIANAKEYGITKRWAETFESDALEIRQKMDAGTLSGDPILNASLLASYESEAVTLRGQLREYEQRWVPRRLR